MHVDFESGFLICLEAMPHPGADCKSACPVKIRRTTVIVSVVKYFSCIRGECYCFGQILWLFSQDAKEVNYISVNVIHRLDGRRGFVEQYRT